jgi:hypothetical protein
MLYGDPTVRSLSRTNSEEFCPWMCSPATSNFRVTSSTEILEKYSTLSTKYLSSKQNLFNDKHTMLSSKLQRRHLTKGVQALPAQGTSVIRRHLPRNLCSSCTSVCSVVLHCSSHGTLTYICDSSWRDPCSVFLPSTEYVNRSRFRNVVFSSLLKFWTMDKVQNILSSLSVISIRRSCSELSSGSHSRNILPLLQFTNNEIIHLF